MLSTQFKRLLWPGTDYAKMSGNLRLSMILLSVNMGVEKVCDKHNSSELLFAKDSKTINESLLDQN